MGCGSYSYNTAINRTRAYATMNSSEIFSHNMNQQMSIKDKIRECCESEEHPNILPIIIGLDVTGSMGRIPLHLIQKDFPEIIKKILEEGIEHPEVCFVAFGDHKTDNAPLQVGQFEASDELMEKWLKMIYIEGGGGGNGGESISLVHYFAAYHTNCDAIIKRGKRGILITISDEPTHHDYAKRKMSDIFGAGIECDLTAGEMLNEAQNNWEVYHINFLDSRGRRPDVKGCWEELLGDHFMSVESNDDTNVSNLISEIICKTVSNGNTTTATIASNVSVTDQNHLL